jgi:hypothetical protein
VYPDGTLGPIEDRRQKSKGPHDAAAAGGVSKAAVAGGVSKLSREELLDKVKDVQAKIEERKQWKPMLQRPDGTLCGKGNIKKQNHLAQLKSKQLASRLAELQALLDGGGAAAGAGVAQHAATTVAVAASAAAQDAADEDGDDGDDSDDASADDAGDAEVEFSSSDEADGGADE